MNLSDTLSSARRRAGGGSLMRQRTLWAYVFVSAPLVGLFVFENGLAMAAFVLVSGMPLVVELGVAIDILIAAFIFGIFFFHMNTTFDSLDVEQMARLKEED